MNVAKVRGVGLALAVMTTAAALSAATSAAAAAGGRLQVGNTCQSVAGINAYAKQNGFTPRYVAESCNQQSGTHWNPMNFPD